MLAQPGSDMPSASASAFMESAVPDRRRRCRGHFHEAFVVDLFGGQQFAGVPEHGTGTDQLAFVVTIEHGPAGQDDGGQVGGGGSHQTGRGGLVTASGQHHAIKGITVQNFHQPQIGQVAVQGRSWSTTLLGNRVDGKLHGNATCIPNTSLDPLGEFDVMAVTGCQVAAGLGDADDRAAGLQFIPCQAVVHVAFDIEGGHIGVIGVVEPLLAA
ncbi:hypothetical protein PSCICO_24170 [Pseudomonas cichorii]|nr:hypothetical protein PSCICO_24170 [Pseudomonas cichorii]